jgi:hypothetical protein
MSSGVHYKEDGHFIGFALGLDSASSSMGFVQTSVPP